MRISTNLTAQGDHTSLCSSTVHEIERADLETLIKAIAVAVIAVAVTIASHENDLLFLFGAVLMNCTSRPG